MTRFPQVPQIHIISPTPLDQSTGRSTGAQVQYPAASSYRGVPLLQRQFQRVLQVLLVGLLLCSFALLTTTGAGQVVGQVVGQPGPVNGQGAHAAGALGSLGAFTPRTNFPPCQNPSKCGTPPLHYKGGPVVHRPHVYLDFWGPSWSTPTSEQAGIISGMQALFHQLAGGNYDNILSRYHDNQAAPNNYIQNAPTLVDSRVDGQGLPATVTIGAVGKEAMSARALFNWPIDANALDPSTLVLVFPQPGTAYGSSLSADCGMHDYGTTYDGIVADVIFAVVRYASEVPSPGCGASVIDAMQETAAHEYAEMVTNPYPHNNPAWQTSDGFEIADLCDYAYGYTPINAAQMSVTRLYDNWAADPTDPCVVAYGQEFPSPDPTSPFNGKHTVQGAILTHYNQLRGMSGSLGKPMSEETPLVNAAGAEDGQVSAFQGTSCGGQTYGAIYSTYTATGSVRGCIDLYYTTSLGGPHSSTVPLGYPTADEQTIPGGYYNQFQGTACGSQTYGAIYYGVTTGWVVGCIEQYYENLGSHDPVNGLSVPLSFPVDGQQQIPGGYVNFFHGTKCGATYRGAIYYGVTKGWIVGCIEDYYQYDLDPLAPHGPSGPLGFPVNGQHQITGGYYNDFNGAACPGFGNYGSIYYGSSVGWLKGCIDKHYKDINGPAALGFPIDGEHSIPGGYVNYFNGHGCSSGTGPYGSSSAIYNSSAGTWFVRGCIYYAYMNTFGGSGGALGFPKNEEYTITGGYREDFMHGYITYDSSGATEYLNCDVTGTCF
jgi:uncharacterized protein with LGFP repeats